VEIHGQVGEYAKMAHPATFYAVVGGAVIVTLENNRCTAARVAVGGLTPSPVRARSVETALVGRELTMENISQAVTNLPDDLGDDIIGDVYASADFRRQVVGVEVKHALLHATGVSHH
jgi:CO/xanthine dehydrogenase FAD-binding subunit